MKLIENWNDVSSPARIIESRGTQAKFVSYANKNLCAKFHAFFHPVTIYTVAYHPKPAHYNLHGINERFSFN